MGSHQRDQDPQALLIGLVINVQTLTADELTVHRLRKTILDELSVEFPGGVTALLGPNGAGKTTLLNALARPWTASSGEIKLTDQHGSVVRDRQREWNARVGMMPQSPRFFSGFTALESVTYSAWLKGESGAVARRLAGRSLEVVDLAGLGASKVRRLSGGQQRRVAFAQTIAHDPEILLLDEPTVGLDPEQRERFHDAIREAGDHITILSTHLVQDVTAVAERVIILAYGRICFSGSVDELAAGRKDNETLDRAVEKEYLRLVRASRLD